MLNKIPVFTDGWVVRGTQNIPKLVNWKTGKIINLDNAEILSFLQQSNGKRNFAQIILNLAQYEPEEIYTFFNKFLKAGIIKYVDFPENKMLETYLGQKEPWLREVHLDTTSKCNLRCKHCFWGNNIGDNLFLPFDEWRKIIKNISVAGVARVVISGGEVFTRDDIEKFIEAIVKERMFLAGIFTNGTVWNEQVEKVIKKIIENKIETNFYISLDGYTKEQHEFIRGENTFVKTINTIKKLLALRKEYGIQYKVVINSLVHRKNYSQVEPWYDFLAQLGVDHWRITAGRNLGNFNNNKEEIGTALQDRVDYYLKLIVKAKDKQNSKNKYPSINVENYFSSKVLQEKKSYIFAEDLNICDYKYNGCSISPLGDVQFCTSWQNRTFGNVLEKDLEDIWHSKQLQQMKNMKIAYITGCRECQYLSYCGGGCRCECINIFGKDESVCANYPIFVDKILPVLKDLGIEFEV